MATIRNGNVTVYTADTYTPPANQTVLYNALGRGAAEQAQQGGFNPFGFINDKINSAANAFGTTVAAGADVLRSGLNLFGSNEGTGLENTATKNLRQTNKRNLDDVYRAHGFQSRNDFINQLDAAENSGNQAEADRLMALEQSFTNELQNTANENAAAAEAKQKGYQDYRQNSYIGQKVNQDRGKFAGSALNTLSTMADVAGMATGAPFLMIPNRVAGNALQGAIGGVANELERNGFENFNWNNAAQGAVIGGLSGAATGALNQKFQARDLAAKAAAQNGVEQQLTSGGLRGLFNKAAGSQIGRGAMSGALGGAIGGGLSAGMNGGDVMSGAGQGALQGALSGATSSAIMQGATKLGGAALNKISPELAAKMEANTHAYENWRKSGDTFNERLNATLTSGDSRVGNWLMNGGPKNLANKISERGVGLSIKNTAPQFDRQNGSVDSNIAAIRDSIKNENVSYDELAYLREHMGDVVKSGDIDLMQWAGVPEFLDNNVSVRDWYIKNYPDDAANLNIDPDMTFDDYYNAVRNGDWYAGGVDDSVVRERLFESLDELYGDNYRQESLTEANMQKGPRRLSYGGDSRYATDGWGNPSEDASAMSRVGGGITIPENEADIRNMISVYEKTLQKDMAAYEAETDPNMKQALSSQVYQDKMRLTDLNDALNELSTTQTSSTAQHQFGRSGYDNLVGNLANFNNPEELSRAIMQTGLTPAEFLDSLTDDNYHSERVLAEAIMSGNPDYVNRAKQILADHNHDGFLASYNMQKRDELVKEMNNQTSSTAQGTVKDLLESAGIKPDTTKIRPETATQQQAEQFAREVLDWETRTQGKEYTMKNGNGEDWSPNELRVQEIARGYLERPQEVMQAFANASNNLRSLPDNLNIDPNVDPQEAINELIAIQNKYGLNLNSKPQSEYPQTRAKTDISILNANSEPKQAVSIADFQEQGLGPRKAEQAAYKNLISTYGESMGEEGSDPLQIMIENAEAAGLPGDSNFRKAQRLVEGGDFAITYDEAFNDLKQLYGDNFNEKIYLTKDGDWKYKNGEPYVWTTYKNKIAMALSKEMDAAQSAAETPTAKDWAKQAVKRIGDKGVGLSVKDVSQDDNNPETELFRKINNMKNTTAAQATPEGEGEDEYVSGYGESGLATGKTRKSNLLSRAGRSLEAAQAYGTRAENRKGGVVDPGETINNVRKRTGISDLETQAQLADELTGTKDALLDKIQNTALGATEDGEVRAIDLTKIMPEVDKELDKISATTLTKEQKAKIRSDILEDVTNHDIDTVQKANRLRGSAANYFQKYRMTPDVADRDKGVLYSRVADLIDEQTYSSIPKDNVDAMFETAQMETKSRAEAARNRGLTRVAKAYDKLSNEFANADRTIENFRHLKKDFVDVRYLQSKASQASTAWNNNPMVTGMAAGAALMSSNPVSALLKATLIKSAAPAIAQVANSAGAKIGGYIADAGDALAEYTSTPVKPTSQNQLALYNALGREAGNYTTKQNLDSMNAYTNTDTSAVDNTTATTENTEPMALLASTGDAYANTTDATEPTTSETTLYNTLTNQGTGTTTYSPYSQQSTGNTWADTLRGAMDRAAEAGDAEAFATLYQMYANATQSTSKDMTNPANWSASDRSKLLDAQNGLSQLDALEQAYTQATGGSGNAIVGNVRNTINDWTGGNFDASASNYNALAQSVGLNIVKNLVNMGTQNADVETYKKYIPALTDTAEQANMKLETLRQLYQAQINNLYGNYGA